MNINEAIAKNLTALRKQQNVSIGKLARITGLSKAAISQIEQGSANPTINTIYKIATALHVPYAALLETHESTAKAIFKDDVPLAASPDGSLKSYSYYSSNPERNIKIMVLELAPHCAHRIESARDAERYIIVKSGSMAVEIGEFSYFLMEGDAISFSASEDCILKNEEDAPASCFCVNHYSFGSATSLSNS